VTQIIIIIIIIIIIYRSRNTTSSALLISQGRVGLHLYLSATQSLSEVGVIIQVAGGNTYVDAELPSF